MNTVSATLADAFLSDRLVLRMPTVEDAPAVNRAVRESFPLLQQWVDWATHLPTLEETVSLLERAHSDYLNGTAFSFTASLREDGHFVGLPAFLNIDWSVPMLEIGYWLHAGYGGRGLMTEAVGTLVELGFNNLAMRRIEIRTDPRNIASAAIPERLGFILEGVLRNQKRDPQGQLRDTAIYALTR